MRVWRDRGSGPHGKSQVAIGFLGNTGAQTNIGIISTTKKKRNRGVQHRDNQPRQGYKRIRSFCGRVPWLYQYWPGGFMLFVVLCPGTPKGSTGSGSGFKASQKTGQRLKVSSDRLGEAGNRTWDPWFTRHSTYSLLYPNDVYSKHA